MDSTNGDPWSDLERDLFEPNEDATQAPEISLPWERSDLTVHGRDDRDYYAITFTERTDVIVEASFENLAGKFWVNLSLGTHPSPSRDLLAKEGVVSFRQTVCPGTHYLVAYGPGIDGPSRYGLSVRTEPADPLPADRLEPNDDWGQSILLEEGTSLYNLTIHDGDDEDTFRLELPERGRNWRISASVDHNRVAGQLGLWIYDPEMNPLRWLIGGCGQEHGWEFEEEGLPAGTYYIRVSPRKPGHAGRYHLMVGVH